MSSTKKALFRLWNFNYSVIKATMVFVSVMFCTKKHRFGQFTILRNEQLLFYELDLEYKQKNRRFCNYNIWKTPSLLPTFFIRILRAILSCIFISISVHILSNCWSGAWRKTSHFSFFYIFYTNKYHRSEFFSLSYVDCQTKNCKKNRLKISILCLQYFKTILITIQSQ